jgi:hypothetical protein
MCRARSLLVAATAHATMICSIERAPSVRAPREKRRQRAIPPCGISAVGAPQTLLAGNVAEEYRPSATRLGPDSFPATRFGQRRDQVVVESLMRTSLEKKTVSSGLGRDGAE